MSFHNYMKTVISGIKEWVNSIVPHFPSASVGQIIVVKAVDDTGRPTEWEAVDMPSAEDTTLFYGTENFGEVVDSAGNPIDYETIHAAKDFKFVNAEGKVYTPVFVRDYGNIVEFAILEFAGEFTMYSVGAGIA